MSFRLGADIQDDPDYKWSIAQNTASHSEVFHIDFQEIFVVDADASSESVNSRVWLFAHDHTSIHMQIVGFDILGDREALGEDRFTIEISCVKECLISVDVDEEDVSWHLLVIINGYYIARLEVLDRNLCETKNTESV